MFVTRSAFSIKESPNDIANDLFRQLDNKNKETSINDIILLFSSFKLNNQEIISCLSNVLPSTNIIGCSSYAEISYAGGYRRNSASALRLSSDKVTFHTGLIPNISAAISSNSLQKIISQELSSILSDNNDIRLCLTFTDMLCYDENKVLSELQKCLGQEIIILGGSAAESFRSIKTEQFYGSKTYQDTLIYLLIGGAIDFSFAASNGWDNGWDPLGEIVTAKLKSPKTITHINRQPALHYFSASGHNLSDPLFPIIHPLAIYEQSAKLISYLCGIDQFDHQNQTIQLTKSIPNRQRIWIQLTQPNPRKICAASQHATITMLENYPGEYRPDAILIISCATRSLALGNMAHNEWSAVDTYRPYSTPTIGFYSYSEIAPPISQGNSLYPMPYPSAKVHSSTYLIIGFGERIDLEQRIQNYSNNLLNTEIKRQQAIMTSQESKLQQTKEDNQKLHQELNQLRRRLNIENQNIASLTLQDKEVLILNTLYKIILNSQGKLPNTWFTEQGKLKFKPLAESIYRHLLNNHKNSDDLPSLSFISTFFSSLNK